MRTDPGWAIPVTDEVDVVAAYAETATADAEDRPPGGEASAIEDWGNISTLRRPTPHRIAEVPEAGTAVFRIRREARPRPSTPM
jgi:hypothetical protein